MAVLDLGMSEAEAARLADTVRGSIERQVLVEPNGASFVVVICARTGRWTLYDEQDWPTWQVQITGREAPSAPA